MSTVQDLFHKGIQRLAKVPHPALEAKILLLKSASLSEEEFYAFPQKEMSAEQEQHYFQSVSKRESGFPLAYVIAEKEFWSISFHVSSGVLIPRPETELLVEKVIELWSSARELIVDLGTGAGNIAISLAHELPQSRIIATDISPKALEIARLNASRNKISSVTFMCGDLFIPLIEQGLEEKCDFIVSNPPYVSEEEWMDLPDDIRSYEPKEALVAGKEGLDVIRRLAQESGRFLKRGGYLCFEIGTKQKNRALSFFKRGWEKVTCVEDLNGVPRVVIAQKR